MGLLNKRPVALAMLGSLENVRQLIKPFDTFGITLIERDYVTAEELIEGIHEYKNVEYILISDSSLTGIDDGKYEVIKEIRKNYDDIFIAMFFNFEKPDERFRNWAFGYRVYNLYYPDTTGNFNFKEIIPELLEKSLPPKQKEVEAIEHKSQSKQAEIDDLKAIIEELQTKQKQAQNTNNSKVMTQIEDEVAEYKKKIDSLEDDKTFLQKNLNVLKREQEEAIKKAVKEAEYKAQEEVEKLKKIVRQIEKPNPEALKLKSSIIIGVFSISRGAGATKTAIRLGEYFARDGFSTAVIAYDDRPDLKYKKKGRADYIVPERGNKKIEFLSALKRDYQFIILDFGNLFHITPLGDLDMSELSNRKDDIEEFLRCHYKIGVGFSDEWHVGKLNYFIDNDIFDNPETCLFCIDGIDDCKSIDKFDLNICERNSDVMLELLYEWLGFQRNEKTKRGKSSLFIRKKGEE